MNKTVFYDAIRPMFKGGISGIQFKVIDAILDQADDKGLSNESLAYILATGYGEAKLTPVRENMNYRAARIREVWHDRPEAVKFARAPQSLANAVYNGRMGNVIGSDDGWRYRGGGIDQLTGRDNYRAIGLENNPDAILQPDKAVASIIDGMTRGRYRGPKLSDFHTSSGYDFVKARSIINADVKLNGVKYAGYAAKFLDALVLASKVPAEKTEKPVAGFAAIIAAILRMLGVVK